MGVVVPEITAPHRRHVDRNRKEKECDREQTPGLILYEGHVSPELELRIDLALAVPSTLDEEDTRGRVLNPSRQNRVGGARGLRTVEGPKGLFYTLLVSEGFGVCEQDLGATPR